MRRAADLAPRTLLRNAVFVPPGYTSLLFAHLYEANSCPQAAPLFSGFRRWMHSHLGLQAAPRTPHAKLKAGHSFSAPASFVSSARYTSSPRYKLKCRGIP